MYINGFQCLEAKPKQSTSNKRIAKKGQKESFCQKKKKSIPLFNPYFKTKITVLKFKKALVIIIIFKKSFSYN